MSDTETQAPAPDDVNDPAAEPTPEQLLEDFRAGKGPKGAAAIAERLDAAEAALADATKARDDALAALEKAKAAPTAKAKATATPQAKARKIGPVKDQPDAAALLAAIADAETVEIAFSDGKAEVTGIPAVAIEGNAWAVTPSGLALKLPELLVRGPAFGGTAFTVAGYGLFLDGTLTAYAQRSDALAIGAGATFDLKDDIVF